MALRKRSNNSQRTWTPTFLRQFYPSILPWQESTALDPIRQLLNAPMADQAERTRLWRDAKVAELSSLAVTVSHHKPTVSLCAYSYIERISCRRGVKLFELDCCRGPIPGSQRSLPQQFDHSSCFYQCSKPAEYHSFPAGLEY
jgi:hypothetical protein